MTIQDDLLASIEAFLPKRGITESTFGRLSVNDGKFVSRLRGGENMTLSTLNRVRNFITSQERALADGTLLPHVNRSSQVETSPQAEAQAAA